MQVIVLCFHKIHFLMLALCHTAVTNRRQSSPGKRYIGRLFKKPVDTSALLLSCKCRLFSFQAKVEIARGYHSTAKARTEEVGVGGGAYQASDVNTTINNGVDCWLGDVSLTLTKYFYARFRLHNNSHKVLEHWHWVQQQA